MLGLALLQRCLMEGRFISALATEHFQSFNSLCLTTKCFKMSSKGFLSLFTITKKKKLEYNFIHPGSVQLVGDRHCWDWVQGC